MEVPTEIVTALITSLVTMVVSVVGAGKWVVTEIKKDISQLFERSDDQVKSQVKIESDVSHIKSSLGL